MTPILSVCCIWILIVFLEELQSTFFFYINIYTHLCIYFAVHRLNPLVNELYFYVPEVVLIIQGVNPSGEPGDAEPCPGDTGVSPHITQHPLEQNAGIRLPWAAEPLVRGFKARALTMGKLSSNYMC